MSGIERTPLSLSALTPVVSAAAKDSAVVGFAFAGTACGGSDDDDVGGIDSATAASYEGLYAFQSFTHNTASCDAEGASTLASHTEPNFAFVRGEFFGFQFLSILSCTDSADCATKVGVFRSDGSGSGYFFTGAAGAAAGALSSFLITSGVMSRPMSAARMPESSMISTRSSETASAIASTPAARSQINHAGTPTLFHRSANRSRRQSRSR